MQQYKCRKLIATLQECTLWGKRESKKAKSVMPQFSCHTSSGFIFTVFGCNFYLFCLFKLYMSRSILDPAGVNEAWYFPQFSWQWMVGIIALLIKASLKVWTAIIFQLCLYLTVKFFSSDFRSLYYFRFFGFCSWFSDFPEKHKKTQEKWLKSELLQT